MASTTVEKCANCGRKIAPTETPRVYNDRVYCPDCSAKLPPARPAGPKSSLVDEIADELKAKHGLADSREELRQRMAGAKPMPRPAAAPIDYRTPQTPATTIPEYRGLQFAAGVLRLFALLAYVAGGFYLVGSVVVFAKSLTSEGGAVALMRAATFLILSMTPLVVGAILHGMAAGCLALRDIARNSFR